MNWGALMESAGGGFELLPDGKYDCEVASAKAGQTGTGKDKVSARLRVLTGPHAGKTLFNDFIISPESSAAMGFFFSHMKALGAGPEFFRLSPSLEDVAEKIVGGRCVVTVGHRTWNGEVRNQVDKLGPLAGFAPAPGFAPPPVAAPAPGAVPPPPF